MNRALRAATMGVLLLSPMALTACSAGQASQTVAQNRDKVGAEAQAGDIVLRQVHLAYPDEERYEAGDDAELIMAISNRGDEDDTLVGIEGEGFDGVTVTEDAATASPVPGTTGAPSAGSSVDIPVPARGVVYIGPDGDYSVALTDLSEDLTPGQGLDLTFTFENAGEVTVRAVVTTPDEELERGKAFDFDEEGH
ncbi:copper chaperone PCu(A)C [Geodermatophilus ruber]|uniref:Copper(I)-binding protein n=1 Tax=Geodermatophilus ruber TaxID=504800 RepID=A0A1I4D484_9ACTN|nr:copper chaperone PCu(A)C [Geodermatophilus ruber]SFK88332.1 Copper(I)-binding protein [Geodermatophilus ruber]